MASVSVFLERQKPGRSPTCFTAICQKFCRVWTDVIQAEARKTGLRYDSKYENLEQRDREVAKAGAFRKSLPTTMSKRPWPTQEPLSVEAGQTDVLSLVRSPGGFPTR